MTLPEKIITSTFTFSRPEELNRLMRRGLARALYRKVFGRTIRT